MQTTYRTTGQVAAEIQWRDFHVRRTADALAARGIEIPRAGLYRLISPEVMELIREERQRRAGTEASNS